MPQKTSPFLEGKWGWDYAEDGWNTGADENWLKFSYMFDRNVDGIVSTLPPAVNGQAYFNTVDNRFYFVVDGTYYSSPCPKWFIFTVRDTGAQYQFNGTALNILPSIPDFNNQLLQEKTERQEADASLQDQISGGDPLASPFSEISWHGQTVSNSVNIPDDKNAWSFGPRLTIAPGQMVTVGENSSWTIADGEAAPDAQQAAERAEAAAIEAEQAVVDAQTIVNNVTSGAPADLDTFLEVSNRFDLIKNKDGAEEVGTSYDAEEPIRTQRFKNYDVVNVLDCGVVLNDATEAINNLVKVNRLISKMVDKGGGYLYIPKGKLYIANSAGNAYLFLYPNISLIGEGKTASQIVRYGANTLIRVVNILGSGPSGITISNLTLDMNPNLVGITRFAANHTYFENVDGVVISEVLFKDAAGLHAFDGNGCSNIYIYGCDFFGHNAELSLEFGGATYYPESIQLSKDTTGVNPCKNIVVENCNWGPSETLGSPFTALGNHSAAGFTGYIADRVRIRNCTAKGLLKYFVRPFCFNDTSVEDVKFTDSVGAFAFLCGATVGGITTPSDNTRIRRVYFDSSNDSFVRTDVNLITYPNTARYQGLLIEDCEVVGRSSVNAINLHYTNNIVVNRLKVDGASRAFNGIALSNISILQPNFTNLNVSGVEVQEVSGDGAGQYLNNNLFISGGKILETQFYAVNIAAMDKFTITNVNMTGASKAASTRGPIIATANSKMGRVFGNYSYVTSNTNQPLYGVTITSGSEVEVGENNLYSTGPMVLNSATGISYGWNGMGYSANMPTTGTWKQGFLMFKSNPSVGQPKGWTRITTGSGNVLGTDWISMGNL